MRSLIPLSLLLTVFDAPVHAIIVPFQVRTNIPPSSSSSLRRRAPIKISNTGNAQYVSNITLGGQTLPVMLDTGSSDLWVHFPSTVPTTLKDTGKSVTLNYAVGKAAGNVQTTQASIGNVTVADQAFLNVADTSTFTSNIHLQGYDGLLGLGPNSGSVIRKKVGSDSANTLLQRLFAANRATANYITFLLDRKNDPGQTFTGQFTISEVVPGFENITSAPKLDVDKVNRLLKADQHWQALTDKNIGIIGPDGKPIVLDSIVPAAPDGQFVAVIDSGFTFSQVPRDVSDAIYGRVQGAYYDTQNEWWLVPCGQYLNISFNFGGRNFPIHPLDVVDDNFSRTDSSGKKVCIGAFQPITSAFSLLGHYDMILGMSFLRNSYTLLDFGNWVGNSNDQETPFMQMVSVTNSANARSDFVTVRLGGTDTISDSRWSLLPADQLVHSPISEEEKKKKYQEMILSRWPYIFVGCLAFVLIVTGLCIWRCCKRRRMRKAGLLPANQGMFGNLMPSKRNKEIRDMHKPLALSATKRESAYAPLEGKSGKSEVDLHSPFTPGVAYNHSQPPTPFVNGHGEDRHSQYSAHHAPPSPHHQQEYRQSNYSQHSFSQHSQQGYAPQQHQQQQYHNQGYGQQQQAGYPPYQGHHGV